MEDIFNSFPRVKSVIKKFQAIKMSISNWTCVLVSGCLPYGSRQVDILASTVQYVTKRQDTIKRVCFDWRHAYSTELLSGHNASPTQWSQRASFTSLWTSLNGLLFRMYICTTLVTNYTLMTFWCESNIV